MDKLKTILFPSQEQVNTGFAKLEIELNRISKEVDSSNKVEYCGKIVNAIANCIAFLPRIVENYNVETLPFRYFRVRKGRPVFHSSLISEYLFPPASLSSDFQRANIPYHPVMYCASDPMTAILETIRNERHETDCPYFLAEWEFRPSQSVNYTSYVLDNLSNDSDFKILSDGNLLKIQNAFKKEKTQTRETIIEVFKQLCRLFSMDSKYLITSCLAHQHIYAADEFSSEIFSYPSFQTNGMSVNFAIHPNTVLEKMTLKSVVRLAVDKIDLENWKCHIKASDIAINNGGVLEWHKSINNEEFFSKFMNSQSSLKK